ncbi:MAG: CoA-binding protein [Hyphomicrobiales bacterium]|nr:MAG: CoA-binding protein [Hyphomicrobiales bacterium]
MSTPPPSRAELIGRLLKPRSIAVIGASADFAKINGRPLKHLIDKGYAGTILPVNPKYQEIGGRACYPSIAALPEAADLAVVAVPAQEVTASIAALGARGIRAAVVFSSGFGEVGGDGKAMEATLVETAQASGVILCGPNCLGFVNAFDKVFATFSQYADGETGAGPIAFVSQSGAFGTAIASLARQRALGLGYFVTTGNECDVSFAELMEVAIEDPRIKVAAGYLEGVRDGEHLVALAKRCRALGKPLVLTKVGRMAAGARAAASHTGALAVDDTVFDDVMRQHGVLRARNEEHMLDMLEALCQERPAHGEGLGIVTMSGGAGVMVADRAEELGLPVPQLLPETRAKLEAVMPAFGAAGNPVDVTGQFLAKPEILRDSVIHLLDDPAISVGIVWLQLMHAHTKTLLQVFADVKARSSKPFLVCWVGASPEAVQGLRALGLAVYPASERSVDGARALVTAHLVRTRGSPPPAAHAAATGERLPPGVVPTLDAVSILERAGLPMAPVRLARTADEAVEAWKAFGAAVALKIEAPDILHKSDVGGVLLNLDGEAAIRAGFEAVLANAAKAHPGSDIAGVIVQRMSRGHLELVVGAQRNPVFGMIVMVGLGGVLVEVLKDVAFRKAPFDAAEALAMLGELRGTKILDGVRGKPAVDKAAVARLLAALSQWAARVADDLVELDLNPILIGPDGASCVDVVMISEPRA